MATPRETWALITRGQYACLDVRTPDEAGYNIPSAVNVPLIMGSWRFDSAAKRRAPQQQARNDAFLARVVKRFPDRAAPLVVHCSDGRKRTLAALQALDAAGYTHLVGLRGGFAAFTREYDSKMKWRHTDDKQPGGVGRDMWREVDGSDQFGAEQSTGINHCNSFERMDNPDNLLPAKDPVAWIDVEFSDAEVAAAGH